MSMHTQNARWLQKRLPFSSKFVRGRLNKDGTIKLDFPSSQNRGIRNLYSGFVHFSKSIYWKLIISPLFLGLMISIMLIAPQKLLLFKNLATELYKDTKRIFKRAIDVMGASVGLFFSSLVFLVLPILIKLDSKGSVIFKQIRVGRDRRKKDRRMVRLDVPFERRTANRRQEDLLGKPFVVYKFRSMKEHAEKKTGPVWASNNDPRVTNIGKVLRPYHIDEIPQLLNVLKGEMSLVGPRPERPEFVTQLKSSVPDYEKRFQSKPGLTGLAQITCGYDTSVDDVNQKLMYDLDYINNVHISTDIKIIWDTVRTILTNNKTNGTVKH